MMNRGLWMSLWAVLVVFAVSSSLFIVYEGNRSIVLRLGKLRVDPAGHARVFEPGIYFRLPWADKVKTFDARIQTMDGKSDRIVTSEKKAVIVDTYAKWRIRDFQHFYVSTSGGQYALAEELLKRKISNGLRIAFGQRSIQQVVAGERGELMTQLLNQARKDAQEMGIEVIDVRVKTINLPPEVSDNVYQRMRSERKRVATEHRSKGQEQAEIIKSKTDANVTIILATAERQSRELRGQGDAEAAAIYAQGYDKAPEFFRFLRSMEAYKTSFSSKRDTLVLKPDGEFFQYFLKQAAPAR